MAVRVFEKHLFFKHAYFVSRIYFGSWAEYAESLKQTYSTFNLYIGAKQVI